MCKLFAITGISSKQASVNAWRLLEVASYSMVKSDDDGFGYTAYSPRYGMIGERWLDPKTVWDIRGGQQREPPGDMESPGYNRIGNWPVSLHKPQITCITGHARKSTSNVCLENVHPFVRQEKGGIYALAHNGVVATDGLDLTSSNKCDSAGILNAYVDQGIPFLPEQIRELDKVVKGWYACTVLGVMDEGVYVDFFRYNAPLSCVEISGVGHVWCTASYNAFEAARLLKLNVRQTWQIKENMLYRIDGITGKNIGQEKFDGRGQYTTYHTGGVSHSHFQGGSDYGGATRHARSRSHPGGWLSRDEAETEPVIRRANIESQLRLSDGVDKEWDAKWRDMLTPGVAGALPWSSTVRCRAITMPTVERQLAMECLYLAGHEFVDYVTVVLLHAKFNKIWKETFQPTEVISPATLYDMYGGEG